MDFHPLLQALILGLVEGFTEFLPVSSTGHLILAGDLLKFNDERGKLFLIVIQAAAMLAICWEYRARFGRVLAGLGSDPAAQRFVLNIAVAFMPLAVLGLLFGKAIKATLFNPVAVATVVSTPWPGWRNWRQLPPHARLGGLSRRQFILPTWTSTRCCRR
jgi:undecaprenyl-diphosphatase